MSTSTSSTSSTTSASASTASTAAASQALAQLSALSQSIATQQALTGQGNTSTAAAGTVTKVTNLSKTVVKSAYANRATATDFGTLIPGKSRLNAFGQLGAYDKEDYLKFNLTKATSITLGKLATKDVRVQLLTKAGSVVADSDSSAGSNYTAYQSAQAGTLALKSGEYVIKVTRESGVPLKKPENYGVQVASGKFGKDYTTVIKAPASTTGGINVQVNAAGLVTSLLQTTLPGATTSGG